MRYIYSILGTTTEIPPEPTVASVSIRLVGGTSQYEGRVEVLINQQWGTVCDDLWDIDDASVVCRQLGYGSATASKSSSFFGRGSGPIVMDNVECAGDEPALTSCSFVDQHNCAHSEDAGVVCSPPPG